MVDLYRDGARLTGEFSNGDEQAVRVVDLCLFGFDPAPGPCQILTFHRELEAVAGQTVRMGLCRFKMMLRFDESR